MRMQDDVAEKLKDITSNLKETEEMVFNKSGRTLFGNSKVVLIISSRVAKSVEDKSAASKSGEDGALFNILPAYDLLLSKLEMAKNTHMDNARLVTLIKLAWNKLNEYFMENDLSKIYLIADRIKLRFFEKIRKKK